MVVLLVVLWFNLNLSDDLWDKLVNFWMFDGSFVMDLVHFLCWFNLGNNKVDFGLHLVVLLLDLYLWLRFLYFVLHIVGFLCSFDNFWSSFNMLGVSLNLLL